MKLSAGGAPQTLPHSPVRVAFGPGRLEEVGTLAQAEGARRVLLVTDHGLMACGHARRAITALASAGLQVTTFPDVHENPTTRDVQAGVHAATSANIDFIIALGGGSAMDCAKGTNLILTNGGQIADYAGINKASKPLLPLLAIPTTAGTGSEAQSFALISDENTHLKMACGDRRPPAEGGLRPRIAILDPELMRTVPQHIAATAGIDAIAHAVETAGTRGRTPESSHYAQAAWRNLSAAFESFLADREDAPAAVAMLHGAHFAGIAIELSMLGAAHACANPLTAQFGIAHGAAVGLMLPHVVRFNQAATDNPYSALHDDPQGLQGEVDRLGGIAGIPLRLTDYHITAEHLPALAEQAAAQWTAAHNPRPVGRDELLVLYRAAL